MMVVQGSNAGALAAGCRPVWRRIGHKLRGEGLRFTADDPADSFTGLLLDSTDTGFLVFDPDREGPHPREAPFDRVAALAPLPLVEVEALRAAYARSPMAG